MATRAHGRARKTTSGQGAARAGVAPSVVLRGPSGGSWTFVDGGSHGTPLYCQVCKSFHPKAWCYYIGLVAHATVCEFCTKEVIEA